MDDESRKAAAEALQRSMDRRDNGGPTGHDTTRTATPTTHLHPTA